MAIQTNPETWLVPVTQRARERARVVALGGDGIGPEIVAAAVTCLRATGAPIDIEEPVHGEASIRAGGVAFPAPLRESLHAADAILFGAVDTGPTGRSREILRYIRWEMGIYANLRPAVELPGIGTPGARGRRDLIIVRELSEGMYPGCEGDTADLGAHWPELRDALKRPVPPAGRFALHFVTEEATRRIARYAARLALHRKERGVGRGHVSIVCKDNVLKHSDGWFHALCAEELGQVPGLTYDHVLVDEAARRLVACPEVFDVIVTSNLYGDILSDVAAEIMGGMPMAPSAGLGDGCAYFESCHGSALDIAGRDLANPSATILSAALMLAYLGQEDASRKLVDATLATIASGCKTRDLGGTATTSSFAEAVCQRLRG